MRHTSFVGLQKKLFYAANPIRKQFLGGMVLEIGEGEMGRWGNGGLLRTPIYMA